jgi:hypothetical protein
MGTWDRVALRFIALVIVVIVLGFAIKLAIDTHDAYDDMQPDAIKQRNDAIIGK